MAGAPAPWVLEQQVYTTRPGRHFPSFGELSKESVSSRLGAGGAGERRQAVYSPRAHPHLSLANSPRILD